MRRLLVISLLLLGACRAGSEAKSATGDVARIEEACLSTVVVSVAYPGATPSEVEAGVLVAVEDAVSGLASVKSVLSRANEGHGLVLVETDKNSDELLGKVNRAVNGITSFPTDAERPSVFAPTNLGSYLVVVEDAQALATADDILGAPGRTIEIEADEARLRALNLGVESLESALMQVSVGLEPTRIEELGELVVHRDAADQRVYLRDVAAILDAGAPLPQAFRGEHRVAVGRFIVRGDGERPDLPGQVEVFEPVACRPGPKPWVSVSAMLPPSAPPAELSEIGRRVAVESSRVESRAVVLVGDTAVGAPGPALETRIEILAPTGDAPDAAAAHLAHVLRQVPSLALTEVSGVPSSIELDIAHEDHEARRLAVRAMVEAVGSSDGIFVAARSQDGAPELRVELSEQGHALGLTDADVARQVRTQIQGREVTRLQVDREEVPVRLRLSGARPSIEDVSLRTPAGDIVAIGQVARVEVRQGSGAIIRRDRRRVTPVVVFGPNAARKIAELIEIAETVGVSVRRR